MFTWIPLYKEIADKLIEYENKQDELINIIKQLKKQGLPTVSIIDIDKSAKEKELTAIDPFINA